MAIAAIITLAVAVAALAGVAAYLGSKLAEAHDRGDDAQVAATDTAKALREQREVTRQLERDISGHEEAFAELEGKYQEAQASRQRLKAKLDRALRKAADAKDPAAVDALLRDSLQELYDVPGADDSGDDRS